MVSMLIISVLLIGNGFAEPIDVTPDKLSTSENTLPKYSQEAFEKINERPNVIDTRGEMPNINLESDKREWLNTIDKSGRLSIDEIESYMVANGGPLVAYGYNIDGFLRVAFNEKTPNKANKQTIDQLYNIINTNSKKNGLANIPVVFTTEGTPVDSSRTSTWRPVFGGIQIKRSSGTPSTLAFAAKDRTTEVEGFVISGHAAINAGGVGSSFYQPYVSTANKIGEVESIGGTYSDAAWIERDDVSAKIYHDDTNILKYVTSYRDPAVGWGVYMSGITSGKQTGIVRGIDYNVNSQTFGTLYDQCYADYTSAGGDSGAPVYGATMDGVEIFGINWGYCPNYSYFSPISGINIDLGVVPLTQ